MDSSSRSGADASVAGGSRNPRRAGPLVPRGIDMPTLRLLLLTCLIALGVSTPASAQIRRVPAEFEPQEAIWLQWPGRWEKAYEPAYAEITNVIVQYETLHILYDSNRIRDEARAAITTAGGNPDHPNIVWHNIPNDNAWMRDNGPVYVVQDGAIRIQDWEFDAWGGAWGNIPYANDNDVPIEVGAYLGMPVDHVGIVHERGNLEFNGVDTVILNWNVIGNPNRGNGYANKAEAEVDLKNWFGVTKVIWADGPISGDLTGGHIDGIARFIDANRVVVGNCTLNGVCQPGDPDDQVYDGVAAELATAGFEVIRMDFDAAITYKGNTFDADYLNWGVGNGWVILVGFDNPATDNAAKAQLEAWFPNRDVYVIEMLESWIEGGGVHCHTNDQPASSTIGTPPTAAFAADATSGPAPFEVQFTDLSTESPSVWEWDFGDGGTSTDQHPVYTYNADGTYTVSLTARSASGADTLVQVDLINVPEPGKWLQLASGCLVLLVLRMGAARAGGRIG
jgi:agmatine deiminase